MRFVKGPGAEKGALYFIYLHPDGDDVGGDEEVSWDLVSSSSFGNAWDEAAFFNFLIWGTSATAHRGGRSHPGHDIVGLHE